MTTGQHDEPDTTERVRGIARAWGWARSRARVLIVVALALGGVLYLILTPDSERDREPSAERDRGSIAETAAPEPHDHGHGEHGSDHSEDTPDDQRQEVQQVANGFAVDFANPGSGQADWLARVSRWTGPYLTQQLGRTDWTRVPAAQLTTLRPVATGLVVVDLVAVYDTGLEVGTRVERTESGWKVTTFQPMNTAY